MSRATQVELLEQRIAANAAAQQIDLATWIFERVHVRPTDRVLELCCGTGGQTLTLLDRVRDGGHVVALDISKAALDALIVKAGPTAAKRLTCVESSLESLSSALHRIGTQQDGFDLVFCAYGLYYSSDAEGTLHECRQLLKRNGRIVVVGPFGPNNKPLFDLIRASGIAIAAPVVASSESFMLQTVLPWGARKFESLAVHTMVNPVCWTTPHQVMNYWQNTTFYDAERRENFENLVAAHLAEHSTFVNEKWVMLVEMSHGRS